MSPRTRPEVPVDPLGDAPDPGRRAHYRRFYDADPPRGGDLMVVVGNCQAESVRLLLDPEESRTVRVPPVFEMDQTDTRLLHGLLSRAAVLVSQPIRADYRGLPLGSEQLAAMLPPGGRTVTMPIVRYTGLHPFHVVVHSRYDDAGRPQPLPQPPTVPFHDLRVVAAAVGSATPADAESALATVLATPVDPAAVRAVGSASLAELRRREARCDVVVSPVLERPGPEHMRVVNHPGNPVLLALAGGVAAAVGIAAPGDPGRPLLDSVRAPLEPAVVEAWELAPSAGSDCWRLDGRAVAATWIAEQQLAWYAEHPGVADVVWQRHRATAALLGLTRPVGSGRRAEPASDGPAAV